MKPPVYRYAVLVVFSSGLLFLPMGCRQINVSFESTEQETSSLLPAQTHPEQSAASSSISTVSNSRSAKNDQVESSSGEVLNKVMTYHQGSSGKAANQGTLRMSNQTNQPVRLALLARRSLGKGSSSGQTKDAVPAHWDFAPKEGSEKGLILALPNGNLELEKGDILVAFAQDGSRRYWGPYVVGETSSPSWNSQSKEWQLILSP
ncbi:hypothetical protein BZZ01_14515 [Nostocales cyanobacterium HT-58-2]|nr:hypothetical protein BZZ01_14515 [Nostocales cyanobacterium HT-58-2]